MQDSFNAGDITQFCITSHKSMQCWQTEHVGNDCIVYCISCAQARQLLTIVVSSTKMGPKSGIIGQVACQKFQPLLVILELYTRCRC